MLPLLFSSLTRKCCLWSSRRLNLVFLFPWSMFLSFDLTFWAVSYDHSVVFISVSICISSLCFLWIVTVLAWFIYYLSFEFSTFQPQNQHFSVSVILRFDVVINWGGNTHFQVYWKRNCIGLHLMVILRFHPYRLWKSIWKSIDLI